jgi:hypothetical protein
MRGSTDVRAKREIYSAFEKWVNGIQRSGQMMLAMVDNSSGDERDKPREDPPRLYGSSEGETSWLRNAAAEAEALEHYNAATDADRRHRRTEAARQRLQKREDSRRHAFLLRRVLMTIVAMIVLA